MSKVLVVYVLNMYTVKHGYTKTVNERKLVLRENNFEFFIFRMETWIQVIGNCDFIIEILMF